MRRPAIATAMVGAVALGPAHAAEAPPADLEALQQRLDQLEHLVDNLQNQLDTERQARQKWSRLP